MDWEGFSMGRRGKGTILPLSKTIGDQGSALEAKLILSLLIGRASGDLISPGCGVMKQIKGEADASSICNTSRGQQIE